MVFFRVSSAALAALAAVVLGSVPAAAVDSPSSAATQSVGRAVSQWETATARQLETRAQSDSLAHRISALKRLKSRGPLGSGSELEALLRESVAADAALKASDRAVEESASSVRKDVSAAVVALDEEIRSLAPRLKQGSIEEKRIAARQINELRERRRAMKDVLSRLQASNAVPQEWSRYAVEIAPLDGPSELSEKADFVEDTRDKLKKKRDEIARLITQAREEQALLKAGSDFRTDARHFDEEARLARRVPRAGDRALGGTLQNKDTAHPEAAPARSAADRGGPASMPPPGGPTAAAGTQPGTMSDPQSPPATGGAFGAAGGADPTRSTTPPSTPAAGTLPPPRAGLTSNALDPSALLNLKVETLEGGSTDLATLQSFATNLDQLERFLAARAAEIRRRAAQLKADEERALRSK